MFITDKGPDCQSQEGAGGGKDGGGRKGKEKPEAERGGSASKVAPQNLSLLVQIFLLLFSPWIHAPQIGSVCLRRPIRDQAVYQEVNTNCLQLSHCPPPTIGCSAHLLGQLHGSGGRQWGWGLNDDVHFICQFASARTLLQALILSKGIFVF